MSKIYERLHAIDVELADARYAFDQVLDMVHLGDATDPANDGYILRKLAAAERKYAAALTVLRTTLVRVEHAINQIPGAAWKREEL